MRDQHPHPRPADQHLPFACVLERGRGAFAGIKHYAGEKSGTGGFELHSFGATTG